MSGTKKISLEQAFQIFTVAELKDLCQSVGISKISSMKKAELIHVLVSCLMDISTFSHFCFYATPEEIKALEQAFSHPVIQEEEYEDYNYWLQSGYCFTEENDRILVVEEVKELYRRLDQKFWESRNRFHEILRYINASIHLYGVITIQKFIEVFNRWNEEKTSINEIMMVYSRLDDRPALLDFDVENDLIFDEILLDVESGYYAYEAVYEQQGNLPYYMPEKEEFLNYVDEDYFEKTKEYDSLLDYLVQVYGIPKIIAEDICEDCIHSIRLGYLVEDIVEDMEEKGIQMDPFHKDDLMNLVLQLINHTRSIFYRGATPIEAGAAVDFDQTKKRARRFVYQGKYAEHKSGDKVIPFPGNNN